MNAIERLEKIKDIDPKRYREFHARFDDYLYPAVLKIFILAYILVIVSILVLALGVARMGLWNAVVGSFLGAGVITGVIFGSQILSFHYVVSKFFLKEDTRDLVEFASGFALLLFIYFLYAISLPNIYKMAISWWDALPAIAVGIPANLANAWLLHRQRKRSLKASRDLEAVKRGPFRALRGLVVFWLVLMASGMFLLLPLGTWDYIGAWGLGIFWCLWFISMVGLMRLMPVKRKSSGVQAG